MKIYRQGDVLIKSAEIPVDAKIVKSEKQVTVALGEATGHHHTLYGGLPIELLEYNERRYLKIQEDVDFRHQEHSAFKVKKGDYEIIIEREFDYFENDMKKVVD